LDAQKDKQGSKLSSPIEWSDKLSVAIPEIDSDHKVILSLLNRCIVYVNKTDKEKMADKENNEGAVILNDLLSYTQYHFQREEKVMELCNYPDITKHCQAHMSLLNEVTERQKQLNLNEDISDSLLQFLTDWLLKHIIGMDLAIAAYVKGHELQIAEALKD